MRGSSRRSCGSHVAPARRRRCGNPGGPAGCSCSYDTCTQDTDCQTGQTCACHGSPYNDFGNTCVTGNCRTDADCGVGNYCSPTAPAGGWCGEVASYYCHTSNDLCVNDSDCVGTDAGALEAGINNPAVLGHCDRPHRSSASCACRIACCSFASSFLWSRITLRA